MTISEKQPTDPDVTWLVEGRYHGRDSLGAILVLVLLRVTAGLRRVGRIMSDTLWLGWMLVLLVVGLVVLRVQRLGR